MAFVKNPILAVLQNLVGYTPVPQKPVIDEKNLSITVPIIPDVTRRSLAGIEAGWFVGVLENVHTQVDDELSSIDPYNPGEDAMAPYPEEIPDDFDVWLLGVSGVRISGAGGLEGALFIMNPGPTSQGWGRDDSGAPVAATPSIRLVFFDTLETTVQAVVADPMITAGGETFVKLGIRCPRGGTLIMETESSGTATFRGVFLLGLFPAGLGQDVVT